MEWSHRRAVGAGKCIEGSIGDSTAIGVIDQKGKNTTSPGKDNTMPPIQSTSDATQNTVADSLAFVVVATIFSLLLQGQLA
jgi:hypothetical protein